MMRDCRKCVHCCLSWKDGTCWCNERGGKLIYWPEASALFCRSFGEAEKEDKR